MVNTSLQTPPIIEIFRQMCGEKNVDGYFLTVENTQIPNFINSSGKFSGEQIIIRPFIVDSLIAQNDQIIGNTRIYTEFYHSRVQVDLYAKTLSKLLKIRDAVSSRIFDFSRTDILEYSGEWVENGENYYIDFGEPIDEGRFASVTEQDVHLVEVDSIENLTRGTWFADTERVYAFPCNDINKISLNEVLNGKLLAEGKTAYNAGIQNVRQIFSRRLRDPEPEMERFLLEYLISYQRTRVLNQGEIVEEGELSLNVTQN